MSDEYDIYDAYKRPSKEKVKAWDRCREAKFNAEGRNLKVICHNTFSFSAGYIAEYPDADGVLIDHFVYITPYNTKYIPL